MPAFLINGHNSNNLTVQDRGLHYGDGLFETIAIKDGKPLCWDRHYQRLHSGCRRLLLDCPAEELLKTETAKLVSETAQGVAKIILTRGPGVRGYRLPDKVDQTRIVAAYPWPDYPEVYSRVGIKVRFCKSRLSRNRDLAGIKHLNRLEQVMARSEWDDPAIAEGLVLDTEGHVIEGTMTNLFLVRENTLITPDLSYCGIPGIIRECIMELMPDFEMIVSEAEIQPDDLYKAEALFLCNSTVGIWPVQQLEDHVYKQCELIEQLRRRLIELENILK